MRCRIGIENKHNQDVEGEDRLLIVECGCEF